MSRIIITRADEVAQTLEGQPVTAVLSIEHPGAEEGKGAAPRIEGTPQMILCFWDSEQKVKDGPDLKQIEAGLAFIMEHLEEGDVLIHCHAGKSRSAALALGALALQYPDSDEETLINKLLELRPVAAPNILIVEMIDTLTGREGKLLQAVLDNPKITEQRAVAESNRQWLIKHRPDIMHALHPEQDFKPPSP